MTTAEETKFNQGAAPSDETSYADASAEKTKTDASTLRQRIQLECDAGKQEVEHVS